ncbi:DUF397 domain-containing protein [Streptomyces durbertensis]|uniref:DUF397 domain-containing protein n=1 Tax=Streptomyces durbertensis TaxID=2448886 RepID=A0ABR6EGB5_9ACTN|nr:DUF397 domain-containing protein [Streptomyces durbertensis]MBB1243524.1 DUF397 domain-containing protein [Streptomyces durbertensis]
MNKTELAWFKSSYSGSAGDDCVEVAAADRAVRVRDSKDVTRPHLAVRTEQWSRFIGYVSEG